MSTDNAQHIGGDAPATKPDPLGPRPLAVDGDSPNPFSSQRSAATAFNSDVLKTDLMWLPVDSGSSVFESIRWPESISAEAVFGDSQWQGASFTGGTAATNLFERDIEPDQTTITQLTAAAGFRRQAAKIRHEDASDDHQNLLYKELQTRTADRGKTAPVELLEELYGLGFAWRDVARMLGVSVPAVQKWRRGEGVTGANRAGIAQLCAMCDLLREHFLVQEVASWFEMPIARTCPVTPIDVYANGQADLVLDYASAGSDPEQILSQFDPEWRETYRSDYEVYTAADGEPGNPVEGQVNHGQRT